MSKWLPLTHAELLRWKAQQVRIAQDNYEVNNKEEIIMKVKTTVTDAYGLKEKLNEIGWEQVLQILPDHRYDGTLFVIIYKASD